MVIKGKLYDGQRAVGRDVQVKLEDNGFLNMSTDGFDAVHVSQLQISRRIGNTPRRLTLPSGAMFESRDNAELDRWLAMQGVKRGWLHRLESNMRFAAAAVLSVAVIFICFAVWGVPWLSARAAYALPPEVNNYIGEGTLDTLDKRVFSDTTLSEKRRQQLQEQFAKLIPSDNGAIHYRLVFRGGGIIGANAFALPDGTIVVTDELVRLAKNDQEILPILLHEIGHVVYRHSLRQVISHSGLLALTAVITGDVHSAGSLVLAMPNVLIDSSYSRAFETEADTYSLKRMQALGIPPARFADFMERLVRCGMLLAKKKPRNGKRPVIEASDCEAKEGGDGKQTKYYSWLNYLSSHPPSAERIARFRAAAR